MPIMNKKTVFIGLIVVLISAIGFSAYLIQVIGKQGKELPSISPEISKIVITGRVLDVSLSLRAIHIIRDSDGEAFTVALDEDTRLISKNGKKISLRDFYSGMRIKAVGNPTLTSDGMLAREVWLLSD